MRLGSSKARGSAVAGGSEFGQQVGQTVGRLVAQPPHRLGNVKPGWLQGRIEPVRKRQIVINTQPIDYNNFASSDFAIIATLPTSAVPPMLSGSAKVTGTIPLVPGGAPVIWILIGLIISVVDGDVQIIPGEYSSIILAPPDATMPSDIGKVEYWRDPPFRVEAVEQILDRV